MPIKGKYGFSLQVEVIDKYYYFHFKYAWECEMWMNGLRKATEVEKEIKRTIHGVIKHNIGILYFYFNSHLDNDIIKIVNNILNSLSTDLQIDEFAQELKNVSTELNYFFDAFYAYKPFIFMLFKFVVVHIHTTIKQSVNTFWNRNHKTMNAGEIISLINAFSTYERVLKQWGIEDSRSKGWVNSLLKTFICKVYDNCRQILANILYDLRNTYIIYNHYLITRSSESLEAHLNFIFDHYNQIEDMEAAELLTETCATILLLFLMNAKNFLRQDNFPLQIYFALLNNTFLKVIKNFTKKVHSATNSHLSIKQIKTKIDEEFLITTITDMEKLAFNKIGLYLKTIIHKTMDPNKNFIDMDLPRLLPGLITEFETLFNLVDNRFYVSDLFHEVFDYITEIYYNKFLEFTPHVNTKNYKMLVNKIKNDENVIGKTMDQTKTEKGGTIRFKLKQLVQFVSSEDIDEVIICIMNMHLFFKELIDLKNVDKLLKAKIFFPSTSIDYISAYLKSSLEAYHRSNSMRHNILNLFSVNPHVILFIRNLSKLIRKSSSSP